MSNENPWWSTFFSGAAIDVQRRMFDDGRTREEAEFILRSLDLAPGAEVLDVPCGNGRLCHALAERGLEVTGVDRTAALLDDARRVADERGLGGTFVCGDMRDLPWPGRFAGAFCFGNSFGYLDDDGNEAFAAAVCRALRPGGKLLLDAPTIAESLLPSLPRVESSWHRLGDWLVLREGRHDPARSRLDVEYTFVQDGGMETKRASYRIYTFRELARLLERAGFSSIEAYGSLAGEPYRTGKPVYMLATRGG